MTCGRGAENDDETILARATRLCGLSGEPVALASIGVANRVYRVGDAVVRIAVGTDESITDARTESVAVPAAVAAGILTPRLRCFEPSVPFTVYDHVEGEPALSAGEGPATWHAVGRELARLHERVTTVADPHGWLDVPGGLDPRELLHAAPESTWERLGRWADVLPDHPDEVRFLHGDLHAGNILVRDGELAALIDWGDAGFGDVAWEFEPLPIDALPQVLAGYGRRGDDLLWGRVLRAHLSFALHRIAWPKPRHPPDAKLRALVRFATSDACPPEWRLL